jgi:hypothetical protein
MADKSLIEQMLERLVNEDQSKAEELFHEYVVAKSREIYEGLIESELAEEDEEESDDEEVEESSDEESEDDLDEEFEDIAIEADDEEGGMGGDATDDLAGELDADMGDEEGEDLSDKQPEELFQDLDAIVDELQAKFDAMGGDMGGEEGGEEGGNPFAKEEEFELETVREYVEKVAPAKMGDNGANTKSTVAGKNDMGGTTANILSSKEEAGVMANQGQLKGSGLLKGTPKEDNAGNINVPGGKAGGAFAKKEPGHGAEKKGAGENAENKQSLFRGRR